MLRLIQCKFEKLPAYEELDLFGLSSVTTLIGPNGTGKSTVLRIIKFAMDLLDKKTLCDELPTCDAWHQFEKATLKFEQVKPATTKIFAEYFEEASGNIDVVITCDKKSFQIQSVTIGSKTITFDAQQETLTALSGVADSIQSAKNDLADHEKRLQILIQQQQQSGANVQQIAHQRQQVTKDIAQTQAAIPIREKELENRSSVSAELSTTIAQLSIQRTRVDAFFKELNFPSVHHIQAGQMRDGLIEDLIGRLNSLSKGNKTDRNIFHVTLKQLEILLQSQVDVFEKNEKKEMTVNGVPYKNASSGTTLTLSFYGITKVEENNCIVLWDEPENGLHPTRRTRVFDLMLNDERQFIVASHASEFAPIHIPRAKAFLCSTDVTDDTLALNLTQIVNRGDAFKALEILGIHPSQTLFTANVVIWVEGPTELVFYRHWLNPRLQRHGLQEGFHYSYMQYGGALVTYLSIADDEECQSTFDLISVCRHPILIVDSDLSSDPGDTLPKDFLKKGASRLLQEIEAMNGSRRKAGLFQHTSGREVENYLPSSSIKHALRLVWKGSEQYDKDINDNDLEIGQYESFDNAIERYLVELKITGDDCKPKGRTRWGDKVEMMRRALEMENLSESNLLWGCSAKLQEIEDFVKDRCGN